MTVLLVGADQLGNLPRELEKHGCKEFIHWSGRKKMTSKKDIPACVDMVLVLHDFINHNLMTNIKVQAKNRRLPVIFSRRGTADLKQALDRRKT